MPAVNKVSERIAKRCGIDPQLVEDAYPCTSLQAALIAGSLQDLGDYVSRFVFDVSNTACGEQAVRDACETLYSQNEILRIRAIDNHGQFLQVVTREHLQWHEHDDLKKYLDQDRQKSVKLGEPLARFAWIQEPGSKVYLVWSLHHCQYDESSIQMMVGDLNTLVSRSKEITEPVRRPQFSKFVKALKNIDTAASHSFWTENLKNLSECHSICPNVTELAFRTSKQCEKTYTISWEQNSSYQPSLLAVAAWSLIVGHLSASSNVIFGHVLNGKTVDFEGIQEVCGPTLTTVPWRSSIPYKATVRGYLDYLQDLRLRVLPFEQTGLDEYRKIAGMGTFDTLLSVRSSQSATDISGKYDGVDDIKLQKPDRIDLRHPCCIFSEVEINDEHCTLKLSYDERWTDAQLLGDMMDKFMLALEKLPVNLETTVKSFEHMLQLPSIIKVMDQPRDQQRNEQNEKDGVDSEIMSKTQKLAVSTSGIKDASSISSSTTLMDLGMDSLKTVVLTRQLSKAFQISVPFKEVTGPRRTLAAIARSVERTLKGTDSDLDPTLQRPLLDIAEQHMHALKTISQKTQRDGDSAQGSAILLTGATGYLGIEILRQCLAKATSDIVLLVRCQNPSDGLARLMRTAKLAAWQPTEIESLRNVKVWPSDLAKGNLGLSNENWTLLNDPNSPMNFRAIVHNGAKVDFLHSFADLEAANVNSTVILLKRHLESDDKPNFVFVTGGRPCPLTPDEINETAGRLSAAGGYAQTKFVSEVLVHKTMDLYKAAKIPCRMSIVHPGAIIGGARTGVANTDDFVWRYVAGSLKMGYYVPAVPTKREWINLTPVDSVASMVLSSACEASQNTGSSDVERRLVRGGLSISEFWSTVIKVLRENGHSLKPVSEWEWLAEFEQDIDRRGHEQPLFSLSQLLLQRHFKGIGGLPPLMETKTKDVEAVLASNMRYLISMGFFSETQQHEEQIPVDVFTRSKN